MLYRGLRIVPHDTRIDFMRFHKLTFAISVIMTCFSLLVATLTRSRHWQVLLSVLLILLLAFVGFLWSMFVYGECLNTGWAPPAHEPDGVGKGPVGAELRVGLVHDQDQPRGKDP